MIFDESIENTSQANTSTFASDITVFSSLDNGSGTFDQIDRAENPYLPNHYSTMFRLDKNYAISANFVRFFKANSKNLKEAAFYYTRFFIKKYSDLVFVQSIFSSILSECGDEEISLLGVSYCLRFFTCEDLKHYFFTILTTLLCSNYERVQVEALSIVEKYEDLDLIEKLCNYNLPGFRYAKYLKDYLA